MISEETLEVCANIEYECWRQNFSPMLHISEYIYFQTIENFKRQLQHILQNDNSHILLTQKQEKNQKVITGFAIITFNPTKKYYTINKFFVSPQYQNKKIATSLLKTIIKTFKNSISIQVFQDNRIAQHLLVKNKFKKTLNRNMDLIYGKNKITIPTSYYMLERK